MLRQVNNMGPAVISSIQNVRLAVMKNTIMLIKYDLSPGRISIFERDDITINYYNDMKTTCKLNDDTNSEIYDEESLSVKMVV